MIQRASAWTSGEVASAVAGSIVGSRSRELAGVSTDTRDALTNQLFVALAGDRFDAHDFLHDAVKGGAGALLVSKDGFQKARAAGFVPGDVPVIEVQDTLHGLGELGAYHRRRIGCPVWALSGSNGKTTTKEMLAAILGVSRSVLKTEGNLNNLIGVPMTLLGLTRSHAAAVIEMGMNTPGEIARYTQVASPELGLLVNVGPAHIGKLGSLDAIGDAKGELYFGLDKERAIAVMNADDPQIVRVARASGVKNVRTFGRGEGVDVRMVSFEPTFTPVGAGGRARLLIDGRSLDLELPMPGAHNAMNAAAAIAAATALVPGSTPATLDDIVRGMPNAVRVQRRLHFETVGRFLLVDDCYNANSSSMLAAIETVSGRVKKLGGRFVAMLGEMRELGDYAEREHTLVGEALVEHGAHLVGAFGTLARVIAEIAKKNGIEAHHEVDHVEAMYSWLSSRLRDGDVILVKGSRGMKMERFIERIRKEAS